MSKENVLVLTLYDDEMEADQAVAALKVWEQANKQVKLGGIGVLVKDENGKIKEHKLGPRQGWKGAGVGVVLGIVAAIPTGGLSLIPGLASGAIAGGAVGSFFQKGFHEITRDDAERLDTELDAGHAAVGVLVKLADADTVSAEMVRNGGTPEAHEISDATLKDAAKITGGADQPAQQPQSGDPPPSPHN